jgi:hypothetical protein
MVSRALSALGNGISSRGGSLLIAGMSGGGKSTVATGLLERIQERGFCDAVECVLRIIPRCGGSPLYLLGVFRSKSVIIHIIKRV